MPQGEKLTSLKLEKKSKKELVGVDAPMGEREEYPYGTRIRLEEEQLTKLGIKGLPDVGGNLMVYGKASVASASENKTDKGSMRSVELQITELALMAEKPSKPAADVLYGGDKKA